VFPWDEIAASSARPPRGKHAAVSPSDTVFNTFVADVSRIAEEAHNRQTAIESLLHELDVRFVALTNGHPSARFEDWRYGSGEAAMADAHARVAHHEQRSRNEVGDD